MAELSIFFEVLKPAIPPTNRNSAQIADINNKNQVSAWFNFADTVNISAFSIANKFRIYENC
jgi:hypothetical protein